MASDLDFRVRATDMASNVLETVGNNAAVLGERVGEAFTSLVPSVDAANMKFEESNTTISLGLTGAGKAVGALSSVAAGMGAVAVAGLAAGASVLAIAAAANQAAAAVDTKMGAIVDKIALIETQRINIATEIDPNSLAGQVSAGIAGVDQNITVGINDIDTGPIDSLADRVKSVADQIEASTNINSNKLLDLVPKAVQQGADPSNITEQLKAAAGLSAAFGTSIEDGMAKAQAAAEGNFSAFETLIPGIENLNTNQEKLAAVSRLASDGLQLSKKAASESGSIFTDLSLGVGNLLENLGSGASINKILANSFTDFIVPAIEFVDRNIYDLGDSVDWIQDSIKTGFAVVSTAIELAMTDSGLILERGGLAFQLFAESTINIIGDALMRVIPAYAIWFGENFLNILQDMAVGASYLVENLGKNLGEGFALIFQYIMGGWQTQDFGDFLSELGGALSQDLLRGFEPVTEALPDLAERTLSETEIRLQKQIDKIDNKLADDASKIFAKNMGEIQKEIDKVELDAKVSLATDVDATEIDKQTKAVASANILQAFESRVMVRGPGNDPMASVAETSKQMLDVQKQTLDANRQIAAALSKPMNPIAEGAPAQTTIEVIE